MSFWNLNKKQEDESIIVGSDLGYGQIKVLSGDDKYKFLSATGTPISDFGRATPVHSKKELLDLLAVTYEGTKYYVGNNAIKNTRNGRLILRQNKAELKDNIIKFITSLALLTEEDQNYLQANIITGLPVLEYKNQKDSLYNMMYNNNKPFNFIMHYGSKEVKKTIKTKEIKIISQGEGSFYDFILDNNGNIIKDKVNMVNGTVMVVDIGYRTTDIVTMNNGRYNELLSDQLNNGVNKIHQEILRLIMEQLNIKKELKDIDQLVRSKKLYHNTKEYNIEKIIEAASKPFAEDIIDSLIIISNDQLGSMQRILLTGGGAEILYPYISKSLEDVIKVSITKDSEYCNSSGYYKYGLLLKNSGNLNA